MEKGYCYIFGAGEYGKEELPVMGTEDLIIAADGGLTELQRRGIVPHVILGDFDSYQMIPEGPGVMVYPSEKDDTDMMLGVRYGLSKGYRSFRLYGGTGGRLDHTMANLQLLSWLSHRGAQGFLYGKNFVLTAVTDGSLSFPAGQQGRLSVFCHGEKAEGVTIEGCKYTAEHGTWDNQYPIGVSNEFTKDRARISVEHGTLLIYWEDAE